MDLIKRIIKKILRVVVSELKLARFLQKEGSITVLTYHGITDGSDNVNDYCFINSKKFEKQIKYLSSNFTVKSAESAFYGSYNSKKPIAVVTFDDGFLNNYDIAFPILKKYGVPATIFLTTNYVDSNESVWFCSVIQIIESCKFKIIEWKGKNIDISNKKGKKIASSKIQSDLKNYHPYEIQTKIKELATKLGVNLELKKSHYKILNSSNITEMKKSNLITFGAHTHNHTILPMLKDSESKLEIEISINEVERLTGKHCRMFAYPNGYSNRYHKFLLKELGVDLAFSMKDGLSSKEDDFTDIKRMFISSHTNMKQFISQVHGY